MAYSSIWHSTRAPSEEGEGQEGAGEMLTCSSLPCAHAAWRLLRVSAPWC